MSAARPDWDDLVYAYLVIPSSVKSRRENNRQGGASEIKQNDGIIGENSRGRVSVERP